MFENVDGRTDDGRTDAGRTDAGVTGILIAHLGAFGSGELKTLDTFLLYHTHTNTHTHKHTHIPDRHLDR